MKFLLFDENAISTYVSDSRLQSVEYPEGMIFTKHLGGQLSSEIFHNTKIEYVKDGILFVGRKKQQPAKADIDKHIFCIDLTACHLLLEETNPSRLLTVVQRAFRLVLKIWNNYPFSASERINGSKSILFPFSIADHHRLVIERSNQVPRLESRGISFPLLAYKYNAEEPGQIADIVQTDVLRHAGEMYADLKYGLQLQIEKALSANEKSDPSTPLEHVEASTTVERSDFTFWTYEQQFNALTESQRKVVEYESLSSPLRVDGAAGTGKTVSLIMRAYRLLKAHHKQGLPFRVIFFAHSESTSQRNQECFSLYPNSEYYLSPSSEQTICFTTLFAFCREFAHIDRSSVIEDNAADSKTYQLMLIDDVVKNALKTNRIKTYRSLISTEVYTLFDAEKTDQTTLINMLQHEFSIQIKGRTDCSIENYLELDAIPNGIPCKTKPEKELIFSLFNDYQNMLQSQNTFDVDDVTIEAISHLNAPFWRRKRQNDGYDYIFVDEMHLFNLNEQSVFHFLSKDTSSKEIPLCFALDYSQAIGDRGDTSKDYISRGEFGNVKQQQLHTLFRNSPAIVDFCASIAASGTLMFGAAFSNPYGNVQYHFTHAEEMKMQVPELHMYPNDDAMISDLSNRLGELMRDLQCKPKDIAIVSFDNKWIAEDGVALLEKSIKRKCNLLDRCSQISVDSYTLTSPYAINGLEFQAVVLLGADEGRVPQTSGTSDISRHFLMYSAYNMLYLSASRAKYRVIIMGSELQGISTCLDHSIQAKVIEVKKHSKIPC